MSEWHEIKEEDIDIDKDFVNIHIGTNYQGAIYVEIPIEMLKKKLAEKKIEVTDCDKCKKKCKWERHAVHVCNDFKPKRV